jgi:hypothetical protein
VSVTDDRISAAMASRTHSLEVLLAGGAAVQVSLATGQDVSITIGRAPQLCSVGCPMLAPLGLGGGSLWGYWSSEVW